MSQQVNARQMKWQVDQEEGNVLGEFLFNQCGCLFFLLYSFVGLVTTVVEIIFVRPPQT
jgi:hypothetical protein